MTDWVMVPRDLWRRLTDGEVIDPAELVELAAAPHKTAEPVAWLYAEDDGKAKPFASTNPPSAHDPQQLADAAVFITPLYASPRITAEQVKKIKRLASLLETQVRSVYLLGDNAAERKEMVADALETRAALHAALDALTKGTP